MCLQNLATNFFVKLQFFQPVKINTEEVYIVNAKCSGAATILMSNDGNLYACGENNDNRLVSSIPAHRAEVNAVSAQLLGYWAVVVAQLAEQLLPIPEDPGSNPVIGNFY